MARAKSSTSSTPSTANLGFEAKLWLTADKLRNNMDAAEYKHVVLGLIFLKHTRPTCKMPPCKPSSRRLDCFAPTGPREVGCHRAMSTQGVAERG